MPKPSRLLALLTCISLSFGVTPLSANADGLRPVARIPHYDAMMTGRRFADSIRRNAEMTCTNSMNHTFVGVTGEGNTVGGEASAVLGGTKNGACDTLSAIAGGDQNSIAVTDDGSYGEEFVGAGSGGSISNEYGFIGAGFDNTEAAASGFSGAGASNTVSGTDSANVAGFENEVSGLDAFAGAGEDNVVTGNGSAIGAGGYLYESAQMSNVVNSQVSGADSFIGAGDQNSIAASEAFIGSGDLNRIASGATYGTILGGNGNKVTAEYASILGGFGNTASGAYGIVAGGDGDTAAGTVSFAAGYHADAAHNGSFVWSDYSSGSTTLKDMAANQLVARASGGFYLYSNEAATSGVKLAPGSGMWASLSDRNAKADIIPVDDASILAGVEALPVSSWQYTTEKGVRHLGPMAQDFYARFGVGEDDRHITSIDEDGVALAAIKALGSDDRREDLEIPQLETRLSSVETKMAALTGSSVRTTREALRPTPRVPSAIRPDATRRQASVSCTGTAKNSFVAAGGGSTGSEASAILAGAQNGACENYDAIGAGLYNSISNSSNTKSASATSGFIGAGYGNTMTGDQSFIGAGQSDSISAENAFSGGGVSNIATGAESGVVSGYGNETDGIDAFVGVGTGNHATGNGSAIGAGGYTYVVSGQSGAANTVAGVDAFLGAGDQNSAAATQSFIGSGSLNTITSAATYATILGGNRNEVSGEYASILGGFGNVASGAYGIVAGGDGDAAAGTVSFAAGYHAEAAHSGSFVWSDYSSGSTTIKDTAANQFVARASGGTYLYSNEATTSGVKLAPGSGSWASLSDRNAKAGVEPLDDASILAKVDALPVSAWRYKTEKGVRHVGPMAQDFYATFGVGEDDRHITSIDEDGIALAAIKALRANDRRKEPLIAALRSRTASLETQVNALFASRKAIANGHRFAAGKRRQASSTCSGTGANTFIGVANESNNTGATASAILGGSTNSACDASDAIGGGYDNQISNSGSASASFIGGGYDNLITEIWGFIGAGSLNEVSGGSAFIGAGTGGYMSGQDSGIVAGSSNEVDGSEAFAGAGSQNFITGSGSFIGAGGSVYESSGGQFSKNNVVSGDDSFIGAGDQNSVASNDSFVGSGSLNTIRSAATYGTILGGNRNNVTGEYASILGGFGNSASGAYGIVAGGDGDTAAGTVSFAAGYKADAAHNGSFVWSDYKSGSTTLKDTAANQFVVRSSGGVYLYSNEAATSGVELAPGSGAWASLSDRNAKSHIVPLDDAAILAKVETLPVSVWHYTSEKNVRHVGPMAQDFYATFGVGEDDRHITTIDEDGVTLAAIKALRTIDRDEHLEIAQLRAKVDSLEAQLAATTQVRGSHRN